jgi:hypothetical protein
LPRSRAGLFLNVQNNDGVNNVIFKKYPRVLNWYLKTSPICLTLIAWKIAIRIDQQRLILKVFGKHIGILSRDPVPLNEVFPNYHEILKIPVARRRQ